MNNQIRISGLLTGISLSILFISLIFLFSCGGDVIQIPKPCTVEPTFGGKDITIRFTTNVIIDNKISIDHRGFIYGENIIMIDSNFSRVAKIGGFICGDHNFEVYVQYTDTVETCGLKLSGTMNSNYLSGIVSFCPNAQNCNFVQIGSISGSYTEHVVIGSVFTPLYSGEFTASLVDQ